ncbi:MAG: helix-turn-helix domain-containing protein [Chloroflexota bacterium]|nr:helix-turn-helix domain-containing protein [Chloroflexota bacterium]
MIQPRLTQYKPPSPDRLALSQTEAARALGVDPRTLNEALLRGVIPSRQLDRRRVVGVAALEKWLIEGDKPGHGEGG